MSIRTTSGSELGDRRSASSAESALPATLQRGIVGDEQLAEPLAEQSVVLDQEDVDDVTRALIARFDVLLCECHGMRFPAPLAHVVI